MNSKLRNQFQIVIQVYSVLIRFVFISDRRKWGPAPSDDQRHREPPRDVHQARKVHHRAARHVPGYRNAHRKSGQTNFHYKQHFIWKNLSFQTIFHVKQHFIWNSISFETTCLLKQHFIWNFLWTNNYRFSKFSDYLWILISFNLSIRHLFCRWLSSAYKLNCQQEWIKSIL